MSDEAASNNYVIGFDPGAPGGSFTSRYSKRTDAMGRACYEAALEAYDQLNRLRKNAPVDVELVLCKCGKTYNKAGACECAVLQITKVEQ